MYVVELIYKLVFPILVLLNSFTLCTMAPNIEKLTAIEDLQLGEGPHWDAETQSLYFVDIFGHSIHKYVPSTKKHTKANVGANVSIIIPVEGKNDQFVITLDRRIALITWDGESEEVSKVEILYTVDDNTDNVFNDGKCDPSGRLWSGTLGQINDGKLTDEKGSLYSFQSKKVTKHADKIGAANGLAFDTDRNKFYYIDSLRGTVDEYDFDVKNSKISNRKPIFTLKEFSIEDLQVLDGMTIDTDGNLWVALFNLGKVIKIDPRKPETIVDSIQFPTPQITSVAFGGPNLDELYVTSGKPIGKKQDVVNEGGFTYRVTGLNAKGLPGVRVVL